MIIAKNNNQEIEFHLSMANRHGLISGATGTGKTVTLKVLAENFSANGIPVFLSDVKGDLSGFAKPNIPNEKFNKRLETLQIKEYQGEKFPIVFWDLYGEAGHPIKTTLSEMGPILLSRVLELNDTQAGVLNVIFKIADDNKLLLLDFKDLKAMIRFVEENKQNIQKEYGNISSASLGAITRALVVLENEGGDRFFREPPLDIFDLIQTEGGKGVINLLDATKLITSTKLYSTFLLWLLSELFENLPEVGDIEKPKFVFFFDEAHLLFDNAPKSLIDKIEQVVRLIRSKGVGIYFVTQSPLDIPEDILGQLGNKFIHALRGYTLKDQKSIKAVAQSFRQNKEDDISEILTTLGVGEALISTLDTNGIPTIVEKGFVMPPLSSFSPLNLEEIKIHIKNSTIFGLYEQTLDSHSAYETLQKNYKEEGQIEDESDINIDTKEKPSQTSSVLTNFLSSAARAIGSQVGREIVRGVLGAILGGSSSGKRRR